MPHSSPPPSANSWPAARAAVGAQQGTRFCEHPLCPGLLEEPMALHLVRWGYMLKNLVLTWETETPLRSEKSYRSQPQARS